MKPAKDSDYLMAIDIGTTKVAALAARRNDRKTIEVLGVGAHPCAGLSSSGITDLDEIVVSTTHACRKALSHVPGMEIRNAVVGVPGGFLQSQNSVGSVVLSNQGRAVTAEDVEECVDAAIRKSVPKDFEVIHSIPRWFRLDQTPYIRDPIGQEGSVLEVDVHLITGRQPLLKNLKRCVTLAGYNVEEISSQTISACESVLSDDEKQTGVALVDIGGETTSVIVFYDGSIYHNETIEIGGEDITRDINHYFQTPMAEADKLKRYKSTLMLDSLDPSEQVDVIRFNNRRTIVVMKSLLCEVVEARVEQILEEVLRELRTKDLLGLLYAGIVLTGGTSLLDGIEEKTQTLSNRAIQIGYPNGVVGYADVISSPLYATVIGLLHYGFRKRDARMALDGAKIRRWVRKAIRWAQEAF